MTGVLCVALCACATGAAVDLEGSGPRDAEADAGASPEGADELASDHWGVP